jgi:hypothetical protein
VTAPDPADLRLVSALADLGRASVLDLAAHARMAPEEVALRLLRLGASGMRLVLGVESDQQALRAWVASQQHARQPPPPAPPVWSPPGAPQGHPAPPTQPAPSGWGAPPSAGWVRPEAAVRPTAPVPPPTARAVPLPPAVLGTRQSGTGPHGEPLWVTPLEVVDTADALFAAAGHTLAAGSRASVVHTEVTAGPPGYPSAPDAGLVLVLSDGREVPRSPATLTSRPPYRGGVEAGETLSGHTVFELDEDASITGLRWRAVPGGAALDWRL